jgi:hypothetical protein
MSMQDSWNAWWHGKTLSLSLSLNASMQTEHSSEILPRAPEDISTPWAEA